jgi:hypothetical protein
MATKRVCGTVTDNDACTTDTIIRVDDEFYWEHDRSGSPKSVEHISRAEAIRQLLEMGYEGTEVDEDEDEKEDEEYKEPDYTAARCTV